MPIYKSIAVNSQTNVKIWNITESCMELMQNVELKKESINKVNTMKSELHQRGFLSVRLLLKAFGYSDFDLFYDGNGKPHLKDGNYISITHSYTFSAVVVSSNPVGIDIEKQRKKITNIASKFTGFEVCFLKKNSEDYIQKLTWVWCIKEALYKLYAKPGMSFKKHFMVIPFGEEKNSTIAWILDETNRQRFEGLFLEFEGFGCAITTPLI
ncbi:4'-phosphopantetheinyl transferase superfamily protein [Flavobacteriaceae bacterium]|nr:4'-phosphopantetheinyl transferase superfamily protein [Flavobacteriaceae bacterium]